MSIQEKTKVFLGPFDCMFYVHYIINLCRVFFFPTIFVLFFSALKEPNEKFFFLCLFMCLDFFSRHIHVKVVK